MRLNRIKIAGFKSFVDPTIFSLPSNLIGVVGPNGCGKSNVIDAVRWVMGESSAKHLRGESITDVIFNGSTTRKPVGLASVELLFDNSDGSLGGEYASYAEISVRRQVTREGQSTYFLNGTRCRRKDITDIFLGTGLGPRSYSIIEQGTISRLIEAKPEELRIYIEEAAGISKYKERRRETELRIQHTRDNLTRLNDIREELDKQLIHLQRQATTAERFKALKQEERLLKAQLAALRWQNLDRELQEKNTLIKEQAVLMEAHIAEQRSIEAAQELLRASQIEAADRFNTIQTHYYQLGSDISRLEQTIQHNRERKNQFEQDLAQAENMWQDAQQHLEEDKIKMEDLISKQILIEPEAALAEASAASISEELAIAEQNTHDWQAAWDDFNQQAANATQKAHVEQTRIQHLEQLLLNGQQRLGKLTQELQTINLEEHQNNVILLQKQLTDLDFQQSSQEENTAQLQEQLYCQRQLNQELANQLDAARSQLQTLRGRHASLEALQQAALGQRNGNISPWLQQQQLEQYPRLAQTFTVEAGWESAVETALGQYLEAICFPDAMLISNVISSFQRGTLIVVDTQKKISSIKTEVPLLLTKIETTLSLSGLLAGIYIAETLSDAVELSASLLPHESVITKEGIWLGNGWLRVTRDKDEHSGVLQRERELNDITLSIQHAETGIQALNEQISAANEQLQISETALNMEQRQLTDTKAVYASVRAQWQVNQGRVEQLQHRISQLETEIQECYQSLENAQEELMQTKSTWHEAMELMQQHADQRSQLLHQRDHYTLTLQAIRQQTKAHRDKAHQLSLQRQAIATQLQTLQQSCFRLEKQLATLQERRESITASISALERPAPEINQQLAVTLQEHSTAENQLRLSRQQVEEYDEQLRQSEHSRQTIEQQVMQIRTQLEQLRLSCQASQVRQDTLVESINELAFALPSLLETLPMEATESVWHSHLEQTTSKLVRLGAVNLAAIEEYQVQAERKNYLDAQNEDLLQALNTLEEAIRKIDRETRSRFKETFDIVNTGFEALFPRVFGGGRAYLELTGDDLLNTGITVMAQPPGKRNSTIHLLSGGEKAMTAVALVFAIFQLNPAPFCMLDEVDAPLDDANVGRFCSLVKEMSEKVQFVFITHNKVTMELANQLSGVTMHEPGVSRLVAVDIEAALSLTEA